MKCKGSSFKCPQSTAVTGTTEEFYARPGSGPEVGSRPQVCFRTDNMYCDMKGPEQDCAAGFEKLRRASPNVPDWQGDEELHKAQEACMDFFPVFFDYHSGQEGQRNHTGRAKRSDSTTGVSHGNCDFEVEHVIVFSDLHGSPGMD